MKVILSLMLLWMVLLAQSQSQSTRLFEYKVLSDSTFSSYVRDLPFLVDSEIVSIEISDVYTSSMRFHVKQRTVISILNDNVGGTLPGMSLPYNYDPCAKVIAPSFQKITTDWSGMRDENLDAQLKRAGKIRSFAIKGLTQSTTNGSYQYMQTMYAPEHILFGTTDRMQYSANEPLASGDTVVLEASYSVSFAENIDKLQNFRYFFHRNYPIRNAVFNLSVLDRLWFTYETFHFEAPDSVYISGPSQIFEFNFHNLSAAFSEPNQIAWRELPYVVFNPHMLDFTYIVPNTLEEKPLPQYAYYASIRDRKGLTIRMNVSQGVNNKESLAMNRFIESHTGRSFSRDSLMKSLENIHNFIASSLLYSDDSAYYYNTITEGPSFGESVEAGVYREFYRFDTYKYLLEKMGFLYYFGFIADKRSGMISDNYITPVMHDDYLFVILRDSNSYDFICPKMRNAGYYYNELPFYYEGTDIATVHYLDYYLNPKEQLALPEKLWIFKTPKSELGNNIRRISSLINVSIADKTATFQTRGSLSGQFSTLGRGAYLNNEIHPFVDSAYSHKIFDIPQTTFIGKPTYTTSTERPWRFGIDCKYKSPISINAKNVSISMKEWFPFVLPQTGNGQRTTNIYMDFLFQDQFNYQLVFDKKTTPFGEFPTASISNDLGQFEFKISQVDDYTYTISALLIVNREVLHPDKVNSLMEINSAIQKIADTNLIFNLTE